MMQVKVIFAFFISICVNSYAQTNKKDLSSIKVTQSFLSTRYSYDSLSIENPYGLEIPLSQLQNTAVSKDFLLFKKSRNTAKFINLISAGFSLYAFFDRERISGSTYWITVGSIGLVSGYFNVRSNIHLDKAIKRYNKVLLTEKIGFQYGRTFYNQGILSVGVLCSF